MGSKYALRLRRKTSGKRLDAFLAEASSNAASAGLFGGISLSRSAAARLCEEGLVALDGKTAVKKQKLTAGDEIFSQPLAGAAACRGWSQKDIPLDIIFEDSDIIVINKPSGLVVHPAAGNPDGTLVNALLAHCGTLPFRHRRRYAPRNSPPYVDKDTSGLLVVAKNDAAPRRTLAADMKIHAVRRTYAALICGSPA